MPKISTDTNPESFIGFLKQEDALEGAISNEISLYDEILRKLKNKEINNKEAIEEAKKVSAGRQNNAH